MAGAQGDEKGEEDAHLRERLHEASTVYRGCFLEVRRDIVTLPDGSRASREYIVHPGAVAVVPILDEARLVLVRQHRYPVDRVLLEFPAGKPDAGETALACGQRELLEETGYTAEDWGYAGEIQNAAAYSSESIWIWFARGLTAGPHRPDAGEFVEPVVMSLGQVCALDRRGALTDVKTIVALHWLLAWRRGEREIAWSRRDPAAGGPSPAPL
jgi:ADP-ribose pyrophosphatase